jgi:hypothetical protein
VSVFMLYLCFGMSCLKLLGTVTFLICMIDHYMFVG